MSARRLLLLSVLRPCIEYDSELWKCKKYNNKCGSEVRKCNKVRQVP